MDKKPTTTINLRDLPEDFVKRAKVQAVQEGMTLKDFVIKAVEKAIPKEPAARDSKRGKKKA